MEPKKGDGFFGTVFVSMLAVEQDNVIGTCSKRLTAVSKVQFTFRDIKQQKGIERAMGYEIGGRTAVFCAPHGIEQVFTGKIRRGIEENTLLFQYNRKILWYTNQ